MTLQSSGPLKASEIQAEFNGSPPFRLSDYYAGGPNVPPGTVGDGGPIPTEGTIKFSDFYGASNISANVQGGNFVDIAFESPAGVGYRLNTDGNEQSFVDNTNSYITFNVWRGTLTGADYECRLTVDDGDIPSGSAVGAWLSLSATQNWELFQAGIGQLINECTIEIRHVPSLVVLDSASVNMRAENTAV